MLNVALALVPAGNDDGQAVFFADPVAGAADEVIGSCFSSGSSTRGGGQDLTTLRLATNFLRTRATFSTSMRAICDHRLGGGHDLFCPRCGKHYIPVQREAKGMIPFGGLMPQWMAKNKKS